MKNKDYRLLSNQSSRKLLVLTFGGEKKFLEQTTRNHAQILAITTERQTKINAVQT